MNKIITLLLMAVACLGFAACDDDASYTDLLNRESKNVNRFLADHRVIAEIPADTVFETGPDAPYYQIDPEGRIFMQVLDPGYGPKVKELQMVYFRFTRYNLSNYKTGEEMEVDDSNDNAAWTGTFFRYGDTQLTSSTEHGTGIQAPLRFLPLNSRVNLVIKAEFGRPAEMSYVQPMLYNIRYYPSKL